MNIQNSLQFPFENNQINNNNEDAYKCNNPFFNIIQVKYPSLDDNNNYSNNENSYYNNNYNNNYNNSFNNNHNNDCNNNYNNNNFKNNYNNNPNISNINSNNNNFNYNNNNINSNNYNNNFNSNNYNNNFSINNNNNYSNNNNYNNNNNNFSNINYNKNFNNNNNNCNNNNFNKINRVEDYHNNLYNNNNLNNKNIINNQNFRNGIMNNENIYNNNGINYNINNNNNSNKTNENYYNINENNYNNERDFYNNNNNLENKNDDDDFEIIDKKNSNNVNNNQKNYNYTNSHDIQNYDSDSKYIKTMAVLRNTNSKNWKDNIKSFVSSLYYNGYSYSFSKKFEQNSMVLPLYIFDKKINNIIRDEIKYKLKSFLYMSYRSGFNNLSNIGCENCSSDCGWGCMIRCCQMIVSKGLIQKKLYDYFSQNKQQLLDNYKMDQIRKEVLCLFYDNYLSLELTREHPDFQNFWKKYENVAKTNQIYSSISEIIPPYSIHILCKFGKCVEEFTSNIRMINLIVDINSELFTDLNFVHIENGCISRKHLLNRFCEESKDFNDNNLITYNGVDYQFKKPGIVFISLRLGLYGLDPIFYDFIPLIFKKFRNNYGFVSGKKNRAYYFIGIQGDNKLIFVDPHLNQELSDSFEKNYNSYFTENLYLLNINEISSSLTFSVGIFNSKHLAEFFEDLKWFNNDNKYKQIIYFEKDN